MNIKIKRFHENAVLPKKGTNLAACHDLVATEIIYDPEIENRVICKFGWGMTPPEGYKVEISPRSSFSKYKWVMNNSPGQGDRDYQGEYMVVFNAIPMGVEVDIEACVSENTHGDLCINEGFSERVWLTYDDFPYKIGDRVAQMWITKVNEFKFEEVDELPKINSNRGTGGFGSTGK
tara:strand:+ start:191 stop:721 length:531 start_codon:yes stop_codon:yes gene_type:complete